MDQQVEIEFLSEWISSGQKDKGQTRKKESRSSQRDTRINIENRQY